MNTPKLPNIMFLSDDQKHQTIEKMYAIQNLLYLISLETCDLPKARIYASQADQLLAEMQRQILPDRS